MKLTTLVSACITALALSACSTPTPLNEGKLTVAATIYPLAYFAEQVGGEHVDVITMTPAGVEPHDFEPTARDIAALQSAKILLSNGGGIDGWAEKISPELVAKGVVIYQATQEISFANGAEIYGDLPEAKANPAWKDPHVWLNPVHAQSIVNHLAGKLSDIDPIHSGTYRMNAERYIAELMKLDKQSYRPQLSDCAMSEIIVSHDAYRYLANQYDFTTHAIAGLSPDEEPSPQRIAELIELTKEKKIDTIFFEDLVNPALAETIAKEAGVKTAVLHTIEGLTPEQQAAGADYISLMKENLAALKAAMHCQ